MNAPQVSIRNKDLFKHNWAASRMDFAVQLRKVKRQQHSIAFRKHLPNLSSSNLINSIQRSLGIQVCESEILTYIPEIVIKAIHSPEKDLYNLTLILCNISARGDEEVKILSECDYIQYCVEFLQSEPADICDNLVWTIGNIATAGITYREMILETKLLKILNKLILYTEVSLDFLKTATWALNNILQGELSLPQKQANLLLEIIIESFRLDIAKIDKNCLWILVTMLANRYVQALDCFCVVDKALNYCKDADLAFKIPACRLFGFFIGNTVQEIQFMLEINALDIMERLLSDPEPIVVKEMLCGISNILGLGNYEQAITLLTHPIMDKFISVLGSTNLGINKEASRVLKCITKLNAEAKFDQELMMLAGRGIISRLQPTLKIADSIIIKNCVGFIRSLLLAADRSEIDLTRHFYDTGCLNELERCYVVTTKPIASMILNILEDFFGQEDQLSDYCEGFEMTPQYNM